MKRPVMLVDLDGVVYNWAQTMWNWFRLESGVPTLGKQLPYTKWELWEDWGISKGEFMRWWRLGVEDGYVYGKGPAIEDARETLWRLSDREYHIHIVTNRLTLFGMHEKVVSNTVHWLKINNIPYRDLTFTADKSRISGDFLIDDSPLNINAHPLPDKRKFLFGAPHNESELTWSLIAKRLQRTASV